MSSNEQTTKSLATLPPDVLHVIISHLADNPDKSLLSLAATCRTLRDSLAPFRTGIHALPINLHFRVPCSMDALQLDVSGLQFNDILIQRNQAPGHGLLRFEPVSSTISTTWCFAMKRFAGRRIDIGVATCRAFEYGGVKRAASWSFDCFGRANVCGKSITYGRQMREGDIVGVALDPTKGELQFLDHGLSMGVIELGSNQEEFFPYVYFGERKEEAVVLKRIKGRGRVARKIGDNEVWKKLAGLEYDGRLIVTTWDEKVWYALPVCWKTTTVEDVWCQLAKMQNLEPEKLQILYKGLHLVRNGATLREAGIVLDPMTGTHAHDLQINIPHLAS